MGGMVLRWGARDTSAVDAADFYTGIVAEIYAPLRSTGTAWEPYAAFVDASGQPALELGCGDGEPILELRRRGYDVDGVDSSADMLDRCLAAASRDGLVVQVHHQRMEFLNLQRRYRSVFLAGPTLTLLPDDDTVLAALKGIRGHLAPGGRALVPLFVPAPMPTERLGAVSEVDDGHGVTLRVTSMSQIRDETARTQSTVLRYERHSSTSSTTQDRTWTLHWHTPSGFDELAARSGLRVVETRPEGGADVGSSGSAWSVVLDSA